MKGISSHRLASLLLTLPDLPIATEGYFSGDSEQPLQIGRVATPKGDHIFVGTAFTRYMPVKCILKKYANLKSEEAK